MPSCGNLLTSKKKDVRQRIRCIQALVQFKEKNFNIKGAFVAIISMYFIFLLIAGSSHTTPVTPTTGNSIAFEDKRGAPEYGKL